MPGSKTPHYTHRSGYTSNPCTYFDVLDPPGSDSKPPVVLIHGGVHTGTCYLETIDGRPGWAHVFARNGYKAVVPDWAGIGRSGYIPGDKITADVVVRGLGEVLKTLDRPAIIMTHSLSGTLGWYVLERYGDRIAKVVAVAPGPPGNLIPKLNVTGGGNGEVEVQYSPGGPIMKIKLNEQFVPDVDWVKRKLIADTGKFPMDRAVAYTESLVPFPATLMLQRLNYQDTAPKVKDFTHYKDKPVLVMTGTHDADHPVAVDKKVADWLTQNGAKAEFVFLGDKGIHGNSHMLMLETNSDQVAEAVVAWIETGVFPGA